MLSLFARVFRYSPVALSSGIALLASVAAPANANDARPVSIKAELAQKTLPAGVAKRTYLRISVEPLRSTRTDRAPMNVALVIDRSGSMGSHGRMSNARDAARLAVDRLGRDDILAIVSYDNRVDVDVPATKVLQPRDVKRRIDKLTPRGSTAIHAALLAGSNEVRKFKSQNRVNRIVLISDGLANVGPSKPSDFVDLGRELASEGITVSTIGLGAGYNEDLMSGLARAADGGHVFVQESADLAAFLAREFDDAQSIVGQEVEIIIRLRDGVRPMRSLGRKAEIRQDRREIVYKVGSLVGGVEQVLLDKIEVDAIAAAAGGSADIADITMTYTDVQTGTRRTEVATASASFDADHDKAEASLNPVVMRDVAALVSRATRKEAVRLRDQGKREEALRKFKENADYVRAQQKRLPGGKDYAPLADELKANEAASAPAAQTSDGWNRARKVQRATDVNSFGSKQKY